MKKVKGMVMKTTEEFLFIVTPDGEYFKAPLNNKNVLPGEEIEIEIPDIKEIIKTKKSPVIKKYTFSLAAALLLLVMSFSAFNIFFSDKAAAYLALDVNPSFEFSLDKKGYVIKTSALNKDAKKVLKNVLVKDMYYSEAVKKVIDEIKNLNYISSEKENIIQITLAADENYKVTEDEIKTVIAEHIKNKEITAHYSIAKTNLSERETAKNQNISLNTLMLKKQLQNKDIKIPNKELKKSPGELYKKYNKYNKKDKNNKKQNNDKDIKNTNKSNSNSNKIKNDPIQKKSDEKQKNNKPKNNNNDKTKINKSKKESQSKTKKNESKKNPGSKIKNNNKGSKNSHK